MNKHVEAISPNGLYTGEIEIKVNKNKAPYQIIKKKNTGTALFHKYILQCLVDNNIDLNLRPYGIRLYDEGGNKLIYNTIFPGVNLTTEPQPGNGLTVENIDTSLGGKSISLQPYHIKYHFLIPESFCNGDKIVGKIDMCNALGQPYAIVTVSSDDDKLRLTQGSNIDVTWTLSIGSNISDVKVEEES